MWTKILSPPLPTLSQTISQPPPLKHSPDESSKMNSVTLHFFLSHTDACTCCGDLSLSLPCSLDSAQLCLIIICGFFSPFSFCQKEASDMRRMPVETRHRSSSSTSLPFPHDPPVLPFDPQHNPTWLQHLSHDVLMPSMVGKAHRPSGNHGAFCPPAWSEKLCAVFTLLFLKHSFSGLVCQWCFYTCLNLSRNLDG